MPAFDYKNNELFCEDVAVRDIIARTGTPAYLYSHRALTESVRQIQQAFARVKPLICYSMKANSNLAVLKALVNTGAGLDIVSGGELFRAKKAGCPPERIVFAGVGKSDEEIREAMEYGILFFNAESAPELEAIQRVAKKLGKKAQVSLRVNPSVDPKTHDHIATGKKESKFGMDFEKAKKIFARAKDFDHLVFSALHVHIGSQILTSEPFVEAFGKVLGLIDEIEKAGAKIRYLNLGGGLGVVYEKESPQSAEEYAKAILPLFEGRDFQLVFEPGRFVSANAGVLVCRVLYVKETDVKKFAIVDGAMNDLLRPSLYDAYHGISPLTRREGSAEAYDVVGPVCESGDVLARDRHLAPLRAGDLLAVMSAGAYGFVMSSNYNSRPRAPEVLVKGKDFAVIKPRETYDDLIAGESLPPFLN